MNYNTLIAQLPYRYPFLFVDDLTHVDDTHISGRYTFKKDLPFYEGHFIEKPVTPGVILTECCAQIGLVCLGLYLLNKSNTLNNSISYNIALSSSEMEFFKAVYPEEMVTVVAEKLYFRFQKLKCKVKMLNRKNEVVCKGTIAGMLIPETDG